MFWEILLIVKVSQNFCLPSMLLNILKLVFVNTIEQAVLPF